MNLTASAVSINGVWHWRRFDIRKESATNSSMQASITITEAHIGGYLGISRAPGQLKRTSREWHRIGFRHLPAFSVMATKPRSWRAIIEAVTEVARQLWRGVNQRMWAKVSRQTSQMMCCPCHSSSNGASARWAAQFKRWMPSFTVMSLSEPRPNTLTQLVVPHFIRTWLRWRRYTTPARVPSTSCLEVGIAGCGC